MNYRNRRRVRKMMREVHRTDVEKVLAVREYVLNELHETLDPQAVHILTDIERILNDEETP